VHEAGRDDCQALATDDATLKKIEAKSRLHSRLAAMDVKGRAVQVPTTV
jgi:hypothetical protein